VLREEDRKESRLDILYHEGPCLVVAKPSGILTQAPPGIDSLENRVREYLKQKEGKDGNIYLGVPHRLDRPVSGAIVFARHVRAARRLAEQFEKRTVRKLYWALLEGLLKENSDQWFDYLKKVPERAHVEVVSETEPGAQAARLRFRVLERLPQGTWLEVELETGRMHQIRVQAGVRGTPVLGDTQYGARIAFGEPHDDPRLGAIALHARLLEFDHPMTKERVSITAPLPKPWEGLIPQTKR
jgi:23S rRNA pseudouridine1911/1915/1917 synthase